MTVLTTDDGDGVSVLQTGGRAVDAARDEGNHTMTLGDRCDDIVRLIDETLVSIAAESDGLTDTAARPAAGDGHGRRSHPSSIVAGGRRRRPPVLP